MEVKRLFDIVTNYLEKYPGKTDALAAKENEQWVTYDIKTFAENVNMVSYGLLLLCLMYTTAWQDHQAELIV